MASIRELSDKDLVAKVYQVERNFVAARFKHSTNQLENTATLKSMRREIARLKTEARRREVDQGLPKDSLILSLRPASVDATDGGSEAAQGGFLSGIVDKISGNE